MFIERMQWYDKDNISHYNLKQLSQRLEEANLDWESQPWFRRSSQSIVANALARWALVMLRYDALAQLVEPLRGTLHMLENQICISMRFHSDQHTFCSA